MPTFRLILAYDGTEFAGSQVQPRQRTVQGELEDALTSIAGGPARTVFAGRTDRGVHAVGQVAAARLPNWRGEERDLDRALRATLPADLAATEACRCDEGFNPRFDAIWREYRYWVAPAKSNPFLSRYAWTTRSDVVAEAVVDGAQRFQGERDFASFAGGGQGVPWSDRSKRRRGTTRTVSRCECREIWVNAGPTAERSARVLEIRVVADGFLPRMVRTMVGALVEVGQERRDPAWIDELLALRDRRAGPPVAPPQGLTLWRVGFGGDSIEDW